VLVVAAAVVVAAVGVVVVVRLASGGPDSSGQSSADAGTTCPPAPGLTVSAAPEIAPVVSELAEDMTGDDGCAAVEVVAEAPATVAAAVAGRSADGGDAPDVWLPDSSLWMTAADRPLRAAAPQDDSVATSPLVFAVGPATAERLTERPRPEVADLVRAALSGTALRLMVTAEQQAPERVGAVVSLYDAVQGTAEARAAMTGLLRSVTLTERSPRDLLAGLADEEGTAVAVSEQAMVTVNRDADLGLVGIYPHTVAFDYPYVVLADEAGAAALADDLEARLRSPEGQQALQEAGFRDAEGAVGAEAVEQAGVDTTTVTPAPMQPANLAMAEQAMTLVQRESRLLAVLDVSGSMGYGVRGRDAPGPSRISIATRAAAEGLSLYPDSTKLGLWTFPRTALMPMSHRVVAPVGRVTNERRARLATVLAGLREVERGSTPLYVTTLAAVRQMRSGWDPERVNAVVILSDGQDTEGGVSLGSLVATLRSMRSSSRPVPVVTIAFGPDSDARSLAAIAEASGGSFYPASNAADIRKVFLDALGQRTCRPDC
jgi:hypothetical protein